MGRIAKVQVKQTDIEQLHKHIETAQGELVRLYSIARNGDPDEIIKAIEEIDFWLRTVKQELPPKQLTLGI